MSSIRMFCLFGCSDRKRRFSSRSLIARRHPEETIIAAAFNVRKEAYEAVVQLGAALRQVQLGVRGFAAIDAVPWALFA